MIHLIVPPSSLLFFFVAYFYLNYSNLKLSFFLAFFTLNTMFLKSCIFLFSSLMTPVCLTSFSPFLLFCRDYKSIQYSCLFTSLHPFSITFSLLPSCSHPLRHPCHLLLILPPPPLLPPLPPPPAVLGSFTRSIRICQIFPLSGFTPSASVAF